VLRPKVNVSANLKGGTKADLVALRSFAPVPDASLALRYRSDNFRFKASGFCSPLLSSAAFDADKEC